MLGLTKLQLLQHKPQLLKWIHLGGWGLSLLLLAIFVTWGVSLRGQWLDVLPFALSWIAAGSYFLLCRSQMGWISKLYFGGWFFYPAAIIVAFILDRIFFFLVALPIMAFVPANELYSGPDCTLRDALSIMGPRRVALLTPVGMLLEKQRGLIRAEEAPTEGTHSILDKIVTAKPLPADQPADTTDVLIGTGTGQYVVRFTH
ncbi:hypothetical protein [Hymenobacter cellulosilyticus]|uniref:Uncharacterized protein n=1 Tax=Hymenobacter cellulosilyticus TaxID=2932248 RepID=A0A8T9Q6P6_9BACT|nr:hypothetical protein [Hymenobacter cellulosilyticus]UOQ70723.1 hypothetical protein MUN79_18765 [Hymenobacter cellulosilyticus]